MPKLQTSGGLCYFLRDHLGDPIPSPALFAPMLDRFVGAIKTYATRQDIPLIAFERGQRKDDDVADYDSLDNGFLACADPTRLQAICDHLGPADVHAFL